MIASWPIRRRIGFITCSNPIGSTSRSRRLPSSVRDNPANLRHADHRLYPRAEPQGGRVTMTSSCRWLILISALPAFEAHRLQLRERVLGETRQQCGVAIASVADQAGHRAVEKADTNNTSLGAQSLLCAGRNARYGGDERIAIDASGYRLRCDEFGPCRLESGDKCVQIHIDWARALGIHLDGILARLSFDVRIRSA